MAAPTQRPNFLLLWIAALILVMSLGLRALIPPGSLRKGHEVSGAVPAVQPVPAPAPPQILPGVFDPSQFGLPAPELSAEQGLLVDGASPLPGFRRVETESAAHSGAPVSSLAGPGQVVGSREAGLPPARSLERLEPSPFVTGSHPHPARVEVSSANRVPNSPAYAGTSRALLVAFPGSSQFAPEPGLPGSKEEIQDPGEQVLIVQLAPESFRAVLIVGTPPSAPLDEALSTSADKCEEASDEDGPRPDGSHRGDRARTIVAELRKWLESREGQEELTPELLRDLRSAMQRDWTAEDRELRRVLILDLDRRELTRLLLQMAERAQSRAG